jgi:hypothetical protein
VPELLPSLAPTSVYELIVVRKVGTGVVRNQLHLHRRYQVAVQSVSQSREGPGLPVNTTYIDKIDESISHADTHVALAMHFGKELTKNLLAVVGEINPQVHEIVLSPAGLIDDSLEHGLVHLIRNVPKHDLHPLAQEPEMCCWGVIYRGSHVGAFPDAVDVYIVMVDRDTME